MLILKILAAWCLVSCLAGVVWSWAAIRLRRSQWRHDRIRCLCHHE